MRVIHSELLGCHVDLDSISAIEDAQLVADHYIPHVLFQVHLKLHDKPITRVFELKADEKGWAGDDFGIVYEDFQPYARRPEGSILRPLAVTRLQARINTLVRQWKGE